VADRTLSSGRVRKTVFLMMAASGPLAAQPASPPIFLTIAQSVEDALRNYPAIRVSEDEKRFPVFPLRRRLAETRGPSLLPLTPAGCARTRFHPKKPSPP
jgi:hypothetical protein